MPDKKIHEKPTIESGQMQFHKIAGYNLEIGNVSPGARTRIMLIRSKPINNHFEHVSETNVILVGPNAAKELHRLMTEHGRPTVTEMFPNGISSRTYTRLRMHLGLAK